MEINLDLRDTELRLGQPGSDATTSTTAQVVGWPPIRSYRRNNHQEMYVKVSMDGTPYLRKIDIKGYKGYQDLLKAIEDLFRFSIGDYFEREGYKGSEFVPTYEDKDGDWMLVGDVPWELSVSCPVGFVKDVCFILQEAEDCKAFIS